MLHRSLVAAVCLLGAGLVVDANKEDDFVELYRLGKEAYLSNGWAKCVDLIQKALAAYARRSKATIACRRTCTVEAEAAAPSHIDGVDDLLFYEKLLRKALCIVGCMNKADAEVPYEVDREFKSKEPYNYLQLCYYQEKDLIRAASSAYTFLVANPDDDVMKANLDFYLQRTELEPINYDQKPFEKAFLSGVKYYRESEWSSTISTMEEALTGYFLAEEECRLACEKPFDMGWYPEYVLAISNHFTFCLRCKVGCQEQLWHPQEDDKLQNTTMPSIIYHYLQIAYYRVGRTEDALSAAEAFLQLHPEDSTMQDNKRYYVEALGTQESVARSEVVLYAKRVQRERKIMEFINTDFESAAQQKRNLTVLGAADVATLPNKQEL